MKTMTTPTKEKRTRAKAGPTRVYAYGCKAPTLNADMVFEQHRLAHKYHNLLVEIERNRRVEADRIVSEAYSRIPELEGLIAVMDEEIQKLLKAKREANSEARSKRGKMKPEAAARLKAVRGERKAAYAERRELRARAYADESVRGFLKELDAETLKKTKAARKGSGLYWGNYLLVEDSLRGCRTGAPPNFQRWSGGGSIQVQIQKGMYVEELAGDSRFQISPCVGVVNANRKLGSKEARAEAWNPQPPTPHRIARLRIGSDGQKPIWAEFPVKLHREIPEDAKIQRAVVKMWRVGNHREWRLLVSITRPDGFPKHDSAVRGKVGVDLGWRVVPGGLRVAYWVGDDGGKGELILPDKLVERWGRVEKIQSDRDLAFNKMRDMLADWIDGNPVEWNPSVVCHLSLLAAGAKHEYISASGSRYYGLNGFRIRVANHGLENHSDVEVRIDQDWVSMLPAKDLMPPDRIPMPEWLAEKCKDIRKWRSPARLAALYWQWDCGTDKYDRVSRPDNRFAGDEFMHESLKQWRRYDALAWDQQASISEGNTAARRDLYRNFAAMIRRRYAVACVEKMNIREMMKRKPADKDTGVDDAARVYARIASIGVLRQCIKDSVSAVREIPAENTTLACHKCGHVNSFDGAKDIMQTCDSCEATWDQDENAAENLMGSEAIAQA